MKGICHISSETVSVKAFICFSRAYVKPFVFEILYFSQN